jgi:hypothetical protein
VNIRSTRARYPFPDFEHTAELNRELAAYIAKATPPMAKPQDGEEIIRRFRIERAYRTGKHKTFVAGFVQRYEAAEARERVELPLIKLQAMYADWRRGERLPDCTPYELCSAYWWPTPGRRQKRRLTDEQLRVAGEFYELMVRAARREGFGHDRRQGVWLITAMAPWHERAPVCWRVPLPDERSYRGAAIVPARDFLEGWVLRNPALRDRRLSYRDPPGRVATVTEWLASIGIDARLVIEARPSSEAMPVGNGVSMDG